MSDGVYIAICAALPAIGFAVARSVRWLAVVPVLWVMGLGIAAASGAFDATGEDSSAGLLVFAAIASGLWMLLAEVGVLARLAHTDLRKDRPVERRS